jgi:hypothetical protein
MSALLRSSQAPKSDLNSAPGASGSPRVQRIPVGPGGSHVHPGPVADANVDESSGGTKWNTDALGALKHGRNRPVRVLSRHSFPGADPAVYGKPGRCRIAHPFLVGFAFFLSRERPRHHGRADIGNRPAHGHADAA